MTNEEAKTNLEKLLLLYDDGMIDFSIIRESIKVAIEALENQTDAPDTNICGMTKTESEGGRMKKLKVVIDKVLPYIATIAGWEAGRLIWKYIVSIF